MGKISECLEELVPDPAARQQSVRALVQSMHFINQRKPGWGLVRFDPGRLRLFAGGLIVMTLHTDRVWMAASESAADLDDLKSWKWDEESYPRFTRVPSRNGFYRPQDDPGGEWARIQPRHLEFLKAAVGPGVAAGAATVDRHDEALAVYLDSMYRGQEDSNSLQLPDHDLVAIEGQPRLVSHMRRERKAGLAEAKRKAVRQARGELRCEICGLNTEAAFPGLERDISEVHHITPLAAAKGSVEVGPDDLAILCPNCHRAIHLTDPFLTVEQFREKYVGPNGVEQQD